MAMTSTKKLIIFDLDGTLINTIADLAAACNYALRMTGHREHAVEDYPRMVGNGIYKLMSRSLRAQGIDVAEDSPEVMAMTPHFVQYYNQHNSDHSEPYPGIPELLKKLSSFPEEGLGEVALAIASNKYHAATEVIVRHFFPDIPFAAILGQRDGVAKKPDPTIVYELMQQTGITDKREVLYVGDSLVDIATAKNAGVDVVAVDWGFQKREELMAAQPNRVVHCCDEILEYMNNPM